MSASADAAGVPVSGDPALAPAPPPPAVPTEADAIRAAEVRALFRQTPVALFGNVVGMVLMGAVVAPVAENWRLVGWFGAVLLLWSLRLAQWLRYGRDESLSDATMLRQRHVLSALALAQAAMWGLAVWLFWGYGSGFHRTTLVLLISTYCLGSVQILATRRRLFIAFISLVLVPAIVRIATDQTEPYHLALAVIVTLLFGATVLMGRTYRGALSDAEELRRRTEKLAAQLRVEMAAADEARRAAEAASRAKTQFFAAASHDLRQPLHALGLFAEALRQRSHDPEAAALVNSINESVDALDGLFTELLDITKIDTGGVEAMPEHFNIGDIFGRLKLHFEPTAFEKGLALRFRGGHYHGYADPVLVERILRNLVSNAIRYTNDGTVLVSARRRGNRLMLQVWDTGVGIRASEQGRIFDDFYQIAHDAPRLTPQQRKGLGLGLAIVKRLAALMDAPIHLRSEPGRGSVFTLELPMGRAPRTLEDAPRRRAPTGLTLDHRRVLIVEDEPSVKSGLEVLLKSWGASVLGFDGVAGCLAWADSPGADWKPDLLIVDYRLESGHTGIEVIHALRERFGPELPVIMVTGSLMSNHEREAQEHDFHLLIKPVVPNKLRAMIAFKLGMR